MKLLKWDFRHHSPMQEMFHWPETSLNKPQVTLQKSLPRLALSNRNTMGVTNVILNFLLDSLKKKETDKIHLIIYFIKENIFKVLLQHVIDIKRNINSIWYISSFILTLWNPVYWQLMSICTCHISKCSVVICPLHWTAEVYWRTVCKTIPTLTNCSCW